MIKNGKTVIKFSLKGLRYIGHHPDWGKEYMVFKSDTCTYIIGGAGWRANNIGVTVIGLGPLSRQSFPIFECEHLNANVTKRYARRFYNAIPMFIKAKLLLEEYHTVMYLRKHIV